MKKIALAIAFTLIAGSAFAQQTPAAPGPNMRLEQVPPNANAQQKATETDPLTNDKKRLAKWTVDKLDCYRKISGAVEGQHWRANPAIAGDIQTHSSLWSLSSSVTAEFAKCKKMQVQ